MTEVLSYRHMASQESKLMDSKVESKELTILTSSLDKSLKVIDRVFDASTKIGLRPSQEDRIVLVPKLFHDHISFCNVFDGTVGHYASEFLKQNICNVLCQTEELSEILIAPTRESDKDKSAYLIRIATLIRDMLRKTYLETDRQLIRMCALNNYNYASSTGVSVFLWRNLLTVAHIGDSKACIAKVLKNGEIQVEWLTVDHKPHMPNELKRIKENGGSLAWLHGNKPYIRGGDFLVKQANGEHPKQLNYSRAFGGKDLKMFGLSADPDINHFEIEPEDRLVLIASDGLWDALNPKVACALALDAHKKGLSPANEITERAIREMPSMNVCDNVSVIAIFLNQLCPNDINFSSIKI